MDSFRHWYATRLNSFRESSDALSALRKVAAIPGIAAVEFNFPGHVPPGTEIAFVEEARSLGLETSALNLRYDPRHFRHGAFTSHDPSIRARAIEVTRDAVDLAASLDIGHVILWMGPDGFDYPFQVDYRELWELEIAGFREIAARQPGVRVSVEYKPSDPRRFSVIRSMGEAMLAVRDVDLPNFGVTLDFCHSLMAGEAPAAAASLALRDDRLFGIHLNDGHGRADDGLMVGSVHFQQTLELLWTLRQSTYRGTIYFDTFPDRIDPFEECAANISQVERMEGMLDRLDIDALQAAQRGQDAATVTALIRKASAE